MLAQSENPIEQTNTTLVRNQKYMMRVHILESLNSLRTPGPSYKASASALQSTSDLHTNHLYNARNLGFNLFILLLDVFISHIGGSSYIQSGLPYWFSPFSILKRKTS